MQLNIQQDARLVRASGGDERFLVATIQAPASRASENERHPLNLALVVDRSGSMSGEPLCNATEAAAHVIDQLGPRDRFSVLVYDEEIDVLVPSSLATQDVKAQAQNRLRKVQAGGCTNLFEGWMRGCQQIADYLQQEAIGRCFLLTDGRANRGVRSAEEIAAHAENLRHRSVLTSTFGVGAHFDENLLERIASAGGGHFYFIATPSDIPGVFRQELEENLDVVDRNVRVELAFDERLELRSLNDFSVESVPGGASVHLGNLTAEEEIECVIGLRFPRGESGRAIAVDLTARAEGDHDGVGPVTASFQYAARTAVEGQGFDNPVRRSVVRLEAAHARKQAALKNRDGLYEDAKAHLCDAADKIAAYAGDDPEVAGLARHLTDEAELYAKRMSQMSRKVAFSKSVSTLKDRSSLGGAKKAARRRGVDIQAVDESSSRVLAETLERIQGPYESVFGPCEMRAPDSRVRALLNASLIDADGEARAVAAAARDPRRRDVIVLFTHGRFADNWFSHWHPRSRVAVVSLAGWDQLSEVSVHAEAALEVLMHGLHALSPQFDVREAAHEETRGCMFDFCMDKRHREIGLQVMDVCGDCRARLLQDGIDPGQVSELCELVRGIADGVGVSVV